MSLDAILQQFRLMLNQINLLWEKAQLYYLEIPSEALAMQIIIMAIFIILALTIILSTGVMILRIKNNLRASRLKKLESTWEKILITIVMSDEDDKPPAIKVSRHNQLFFVRYLHRFAERLQGHELKLVKALAQPYLARFAKGLKGGYPELRARNVNILGTFGFPQYIEAIKSALKDPSPIVTMSAARALVRPEYPQHCKVILPVLSMFDQWSMNFLSSMLP
ncbi:MAG: HEAT repeat domain-containing protein, partial [Candidatus Marinimicrobia bacterium]|nr:HEAT repeat domain-containing protein [Candidatus Neomarinimicrobiota bacterium]